MGDVLKTAGNIATGGLANYNGGLTGKGGNAPTAPDFNKAATPNQTNAFGANSQWTMGPDGKMTQTQGFGGSLGGAVSGLEGQIAGTAGTPLDNGAQARSAAENAIYGRETSRLDPVFAQRSHDLTTQLANQGIDTGSATYGKALDTEGRTRNDAYSAAMQKAIMGGGQEASRQQGMDLQSRMAPLMGLQGLQGLTGQSQNPLLPASMAQYSGDLQKYGIQQQGKNSAMSGLAQMAPYAMMAA